jgi:transposase-like protein
MTGMANLPSGPIQTPEKLARRQRMQWIYLDEIIDSGEDYREVANRIADGNPQVAKKWRRRWRQWIQEDEFQKMLHAITMGELRSDLPVVTAALVRRARKGNIPAAKLALEASGFWSPRQQHEHTGEIKITMTNAPRPTRQEDDVVDAEVVEDD